MYSNAADRYLHDFRLQCTPIEMQKSTASCYLQLHQSRDDSGHGALRFLPKGAKIGSHVAASYGKLCSITSSPSKLSVVRCSADSGGTHGGCARCARDTKKRGRELDGI